MEAPLLSASTLNYILKRLEFIHKEENLTMVNENLYSEIEVKHFNLYQLYELRAFGAEKHKLKILSQEKIKIRHIPVVYMVLKASRQSKNSLLAFYYSSKQLILIMQRLNYPSVFANLITNSCMCL